MPTTRTTRNNSASLSIDEKLDLLLSEVGQIRSDSKQCINDISEIKSEITAFKQDINKTFDMCFQEIKDCKTNIEVNTGKISECVDNVDTLKNDNISLKNRVSEFQKRLIAAEQYSRSNCLEIVGVPEEKSENLSFVIRKISAVLNFKFEDSMVDAAHRLAKNPNKPREPRGIIVKFCRRVDMEEMRRRAAVRKPFPASELGFNSEGKVYINLSLTRETRVLWAAVRHFKSTQGYKYSWITSAGKIFVRKEQGHNAILVSDKYDLDRLLE